MLCHMIMMTVFIGMMMIMMMIMMMMIMMMTLDRGSAARGPG